MSQQSQFRKLLLTISIIVSLLLVACNSSVDGDAGGSVSDAAQNNSQTNAIKVREGSQQVDAKGVTVGFTEDGHAFRGNPDAAIVIQEFSDFQCPFCARFFAQTLPSIEDTRIESGEAVLVFYDFPLSFHAQAVAAANAARCAGEQGAINYWAMHDVLFQDIEAWGHSGYATQFAEFGRALGLDTTRFNSCVATNKYGPEIRADMQLGQSRGVTGTPSFFVNDQFLSGAQPFNIFAQYMDAAATGEEVVLAPPPTPTSVLPPTAIAYDPAGFAGEMGDPNAPVIIIEYTDYGCPFCARHSIETIPPMLVNMIETGQVYYVLKDLPLDSLHPEARAAANAARCAGEHSLYWEMHDILFEAQAEWQGGGDGFANEQFLLLAADLEMDQDAFASCVTSNKYADAIEANVQEATANGAQATPFFFVNGFPLSGAQPYEIFELAVNAAEEGDDAIAQLYVPQATSTPAPPPPVQIGESPGLGDPNAPIVIVEFSDFQCPFCARHHTQTMPQIIENYVETGQVYYVFKHFVPTLMNPTYHAQAIQAALAAECAKEQGSFWEMHDMLFERQSQWGNANALTAFVSYADELGLDTDTFRTCVESERYLSSIEAELLEGREQNVTGTPGFVVNGNLVSGAQPFAVFEQIIIQMLVDLGANDR